MKKIYHWLRQDKRYLRIFIILSVIWTGVSFVIASDEIHYRDGIYFGDFVFNFFLWMLPLIFLWGGGWVFFTTKRQLSIFFSLVWIGCFFVFFIAEVYQPAYYEYPSGSGLAIIPEDVAEFYRPAFAFRHRKALQGQGVKIQGLKDLIHNELKPASSNVKEPVSFYVKKPASFSFGVFAMGFFLFGVLPLIVIWGGRWIFHVNISQKNDT